MYSFNVSESLDPSKFTLDQFIIVVLSCSTEDDPQIRVIVNDGVVPLDNLEGCPENPHGMCSIHAFVDAQRENIRSTDWDFVCNADWSIPDGWETITGYPPV